MTNCHTDLCYDRETIHGFSVFFCFATQRSSRRISYLASFRNLEVVRMCRWSGEKRREKEKEQERLVAYRKPETRCTRERTGVKWPDAHVTTSYNQTRSSNMRNLETSFKILRIILLLQLVSPHQNFPRECCWVSMFLFRNRRITVATVVFWFCYEIIRLQVAECNFRVIFQRFGYEGVRTGPSTLGTNIHFIAVFLANARVLCELKRAWYNAE